MRVAIMGAGGVGGNYGARLAAAGHEVAFIARGAHLDAMRRRGLTVLSESLGDLHLPAVRATGEPAEIGPVETVLFTTKHYDLETAGHRAAALVGEGTVVITLLNGIDAAERLAAILGPDPVVPGASYTTANIVEPGVIRHVSGAQRITLGERSGLPSARLERFAKAARASGIETCVSEDIQTALWAKFVLLSAGAGVCTLARQPLGVVRREPRLRELYLAAMDEVIAVAAARGVDVRSAREAGIAFLEGAAEGARPSLLVDLAQGRRLELDWIAGAVVRIGRGSGVETPIHHAIWAALAPYAGGTEG